MMVKNESCIFPMKIENESKFFGTHTSAQKKLKQFDLQKLKMYKKFYQQFYNLP